MRVGPWRTCRVGTWTISVGLSLIYGINPKTASISTFSLQPPLFVRFIYFLSSPVPLSFIIDEWAGRGRWNPIVLLLTFTSNFLPLHSKSDSSRSIEGKKSLSIKFLLFRHTGNGDEGNKSGYFVFPRIQEWKLVRHVVRARLSGKDSEKDSLVFWPNPRDSRARMRVRNFSLFSLNVTLLSWCEYH